MTNEEFNTLAVDDKVRVIKSGIVYRVKSVETQEQMREELDAAPHRNSIRLDLIRLAKYGDINRIEFGRWNGHSEPSTFLTPRAIERVA